MRGTPGWAAALLVVAASLCARASASEGALSATFREDGTGTSRQAYRAAGERFQSVLADLRGLIEEDLAALEDELERSGAPWTPGRVPRWTPE